MALKVSDGVNFSCGCMIAVALLAIIGPCVLTILAAL